MKKISLLFLVSICLFITGCGSNKVKEVATTDDFINACGELQIPVNNNISSYSAYDYIKDAMKANIDDLTVEMVIYDSADSASKAQDGQIKSFMSIKNTGATAEKDKGKNYYRYSMISNGYYMVSSRVDNTLVFSKTLLKNKDTVISLVDKLGY